MSQPYITWQDVRGVLASVDAFDGKIALNEMDFVQATTDTLADCGYIGRLYRDGVDLGAAESAVEDVDADGEWFYDAENDTLTTFNTNDATEYEWAAAPDSLANMQAKFMNTGAEMFESMMDPRYPRPLPKGRTYSGSYEAPIVKCVALYAAREAVLSTDPQAPELDAINSQLMNDAGTGIVDLINSGHFKFEFEKTDSDEQGEIVPGSINSATTGYPIETFGNSTVEFSKLKVSIVNGGTITYGTANADVTYSVIDGAGVSHVSEQAIDITDVQTVGNGGSVSWAEGVYTTGDYWFIYTRQKATSSGTVGSIDLVRI